MKLKLYTIRLCEKDEYDKLIDFFRSYWSKNHVFCRNKQIFEFQHGNGQNGGYDFIVAEHNLSHEFHAVLGFISSSRYDGGQLEKPMSVAGALWKVRNDVRNEEIGKLGLGVLVYLLKKFPDSAYITLGLSQYSQQIYDALHFDFGLMEHYYVASNRIKKFNIANAPVVNSVVSENKEYLLREINSVPEGFKSSYFPKKNKQYIYNRYVKHPFYRYTLLGVFHNDSLISIWITRLVDVNGNRCIRLVDIIGDIGTVVGIEGNIQAYLRTYSAEFIDCYCHGIDKSVFKAIGFRVVNGNTIIPNYFEPFERKNIEIYYAAYSFKPVVLFKGDCDQDRPNLLEKN